MLPAKEELEHYVECLGLDLGTRQAAVLNRLIKGLTGEQAEALMALV
jgi:hypothetical protein